MLAVLNDFHRALYSSYSFCVNKRFVTRASVPIGGTPSIFTAQCFVWRKNSSVAPSARMRASAVRNDTRNMPSHLAFSIRSLRSCVKIRHVSSAHFATLAFSIGSGVLVRCGVLRMACNWMPFQNKLARLHSTLTEKRKVAPTRVPAPTGDQKIATRLL
jgi:hypothetical protein